MAMAPASFRTLSFSTIVLTIPKLLLPIANLTSRRRLPNYVGFLVSLNKYSFITGLLLGFSLFFVAVPTNMDMQQQQNSLLAKAAADWPLRGWQAAYLATSGEEKITAADLELTFYYFHEFMIFSFFFSSRPQPPTRRLQTHTLMHMHTQFCYL